MYPTVEFMLPDLLIHMKACISASSAFGVVQLAFRVLSSPFERRERG